MCFSKSKGAIFQKGSIEGLAVFFKKYSRYVSEGWPAKRNRIQQKYGSRLLSFLLPFCQNNVHQHTQSEMAVFSSSICKKAAALQILWVFRRGFCYKSAKAIQSLLPRLKIKEQSWEIHAMPTYVPGVTPPGWLLISALCMAITWPSIRTLKLSHTP